jgi:hypothetical protein
MISLDPEVSDGAVHAVVLGPVKFTPAAEHMIVSL